MTNLFIENLNPVPEIPPVDPDFLSGETMKDFSIGFTPIYLSGAKIVGFGKIPTIDETTKTIKATKKKAADVPPKDAVAVLVPWFSINDQTYILKHSTFEDIVDELMEYLDNQSIDCTAMVKANEISKLVICDKYGLKISMKFENISGDYELRGKSVLSQFVVEYASSKRAGKIRFNNYVPANITEDMWRFISSIDPSSKVVLRDVHCYKYVANNYSTEIWFEAKTGKLVAIIADKN